MLNLIISSLNPFKHILTLSAGEHTVQPKRQYKSTPLHLSAIDGYYQLLTAIQQIQVESK